MHLVMLTWDTVESLCVHNGRTDVSVWRQFFIPTVVYITVILKEQPGGKHDTSVIG